MTTLPRKPPATARISRLQTALTGMVGLGRSLPTFFRNPITPENAKEAIRAAVERRGESFLEIACTLIYENPQSPYLRLLKAARCEFSDLCILVRGEGLERALVRLAAEGVYFDAEEYRGMKEVVRGREVFRVMPSDFEYRRSQAGLPIESGGSTSRPVRTIISLEWQAEIARVRAIFFSAHGLFDYAHATYDGILPASGGINNLLQHAKLGLNTDRWFARPMPNQSPLEDWHMYLCTYLVVIMGKCYGPGFPAPQFIAEGDVQTIINWIVKQRSRNRSACVKTAASNAVRIARAAFESSVDLAGTKFIVTGEPFTEAKRETIASVGASAVPFYSFTETANVGVGCALPLSPDEVHLNQTLITAVLHPEPLSLDDAIIRPLLFTTVYPRTDRMLLNVANGDYGILESRDCGCALEEAGLRLHLYHIRSYDKFTSEGMNYFFGDLHEFLEKTLPTQYGGGPGDYQLVEEEDETGQTRLTLRVHPQAGNFDTSNLLARVRSELGRGSRGRAFQARVWDQAGTLRVSREAPLASARGKILPLQLQKKRES
jgi:hypothetical protein